MYKVGKTENGKDIYAYDIPELDCRTKGPGLNDQQIEMIATTEALDRDGEIISIDGWNLKNYKKNPVILAAHNYFSPAIGRATSVKIKDKKMILKIEFPEEGLNPMADIYRKLYKSEFMKAGSIGFLPIKWEYGDEKQSSYWRKYIEQEMLEFSLVTVPSNPEALMGGKGGFREAVKSGIIKEAEFEKLRKSIFGMIDEQMQKQPIFVPDVKIEGEDENEEEPNVDESEQHGDTPSAEDETEEKEDDKPDSTDEPDEGQGEEEVAEDEKVEDQEAPADEGEDKALTPAQKKYREQLVEALKDIVSGEDGVQLSEALLKNYLEAAKARGVQSEAVEHYSKLLLGEGSDETKTSPNEEEDGINAIKAAADQSLKVDGK